MNTRTDLELALDEYLADRGDRLPDRVLEDALTEVDHTAQHRRPILAWRFPSMSTPLRLGLAAAAVIIAAAGGIYLFNARFNANNYKFTHANGAVEPKRVDKMVDPDAEAKAAEKKAAAAKK